MSDSRHRLQPNLSRHDEREPQLYEKPDIRIFTEEEIVAQLGPAQLYTGGMPFGF